MAAISKCRPFMMCPHDTAESMLKRSDILYAYIILNTYCQVLIQGRSILPIQNGEFQNLFQITADFLYPIVAKHLIELSWKCLYKQYLGRFNFWEQFGKSFNITIL